MDGIIKMISDNRIEVLVSSMNQKDHSLLEKINIQSSVIVGNQCDRNEIEHFFYKNHNVLYLNFCEKGVGLNRNNALMRATGDICLFADDDMQYVDDYPQIVQDVFMRHPNADVIIFNLEELVPSRYIIRREFRVNKFNFMRFGAARIAVKRESVFDNGILFNLTFGGGTKHGNGEDTLFLASCLRKKLVIYAVPITIAKLTEERESSWFNGYNEKYFTDKGALFKQVSIRWWKLICFQDAIRHYGLYRRKWIDCYKMMIKK